MTRLHFVKKARCVHPSPIDYSVDGKQIQIGEPYWWWKFKHGTKRISKTRPRRSQLTQSNFLGQWYEIEYDISPGSLEDIIERVEALIEECQESLDNMPEHLQESSSSGEILQERIDGMQEWLDEAQNAELDTMSEKDLEAIVENLPSF